MKKFFAIALGVLFVSTLAQAQITNPGFENWSTESANSLFPPNNPYSYQVPDGWSTPNQFTADPAFLGFETSAKDTVNKNSGTASIKLTSDEVSLPIIGTVGIPGIVTNGSLDVNVTTFSFDVSGGSPISTRPEKLEGFYMYMPSGADQGSVQVTLFSQGNTVGEGSFTATSASSFTAFSVDIVYTDCAMPDTALIVISSSPLTSAVPGSVMNVDDLQFTGTGVVNPIAEDDMAATAVDQMVQIDVTGNDVICNAGTYTVTIQPSNGTVVNNNNGTFDYTPNAGYSGADVFRYELCDGSACDLADVDIDVVSGVIDPNANLISVRIYPNPASSFVVFEAEMPNMDTELVVYSMNGQLMFSQSLESNINKIDVTTYNSGLYLYRIVDADGQVLATGNFEVK